MAPIGDGQPAPSPPTRGSGSAIKFLRGAWDGALAKIEFGAF